MLIDNSICRDILLGAATGDALGVPYEFEGRRKVRELFIPEMVGNDSETIPPTRWGQRVPAGSWSDDTSMSVAAMCAIIDEHGEVNYKRIMEYFSDWWTKPKFCSQDFAFGLGQCVANALSRFSWGWDPFMCGGTRLKDNGNGSLMRIFPFSLIAFKRNMSEEDTLTFIAKASAITHAHEISKMGCFVYTEFLRECISGKNKANAMKAIQQIDYGKYFEEDTLREYQHLLKEAPESWDEGMNNESGYVVDTLFSAVYCIMNTENYKNAVTKAVLLGGDADTVACVTGSLAAALYGMESIPERWLEKLAKREELLKTADDFAAVI